MESVVLENGAGGRPETRVCAGWLAVFSATVVLVSVLMVVVVEEVREREGVLLLLFEECRDRLRSCLLSLLW